MNELENKLIDLLNECAAIPPTDKIPFENIEKLLSFKICQKAFDQDVDFADSIKRAGIFGTFDKIFYRIYEKSIIRKKNHLSLNKNKALEILSEFRKLFSSSKIQFTASARLLGVNMRYKQIILPNNIKLYRLSKKESEARIAHLSKDISNFKQEVISFHPIEIQFSLDIPLDKSNEGCYFDAVNEGSAIANRNFLNVLNGFLFVFDKYIELGPQIFKGGPQESLGSFIFAGWDFDEQSFFVKTFIKKKDIALLIKAINLVSAESTIGDQVLSRALHRFLLGRKRRDLIDKFIDYVICWESLLLTSKGDQKDQELSYRFSINGASLLSIIKKDKDRKKYFKKMKSIYRLRSNIVHGGDDKNIKKNITRGNFKDLKEVCEFLENNFRTSIWWLTSMEPINRPYLKVDGWEDLLWS